MKSILASATTIFMLIPLCATAQENYKCDVSDFIGFDRSDQGFIAANLEKTFDFRLSGEMVSLTSHSDVFESSEETYQITSRALLDTIAVEQEHILGLSTVIFSSNRADDIQRYGYFDAMISIVSRSYSNNWQLRCR